MTTLLEKPRPCPATRPETADRTDRAADRFSRSYAPEGEPSLSSLGREGRRRPRLVLGCSGAEWCVLLVIAPAALLALWLFVPVAFDGARVGTGLLWNWLCGVLAGSPVLAGLTLALVATVALFLVGVRRLTGKRVRR